MQEGQHLQIHDLYSTIGAPIVQGRVPVMVRNEYMVFLSGLIGDQQEHYAIMAFLDSELHAWNDEIRLQYEADITQIVENIGSVFVSVEHGDETWGPFYASMGFEVIAFWNNGLPDKENESRVILQRKCSKIQQTLEAAALEARHVEGSA